MNNQCECPVCTGLIYISEAKKDISCPYCHHHLDAAENKETGKIELKVAHEAQCPVCEGTIYVPNGATNVTCAYCHHNYKVEENKETGKIKLKVTNEMKCPVCGGTIYVPDDATNITCQYCGYYKKLEENKQEDRIALAHCPCCDNDSIVVSNNSNEAICRKCFKSYEVSYDEATGKRNIVNAKQEIKEDIGRNK